MEWRDRLDGKLRSKDDDERLEELMDRHGAAIHRLALAIVGPDEAADVTQEVLVLAWQRLGQLRDDASAAAWIRRIVVNRCLDRGRAASRRVRTIQMLNTDDPRTPSADPPQVPGFDPVLETALRGLPVAQRAVVALHYAADLSIEDVADALHVPVGTAKSRLSAALHQLRRELVDPR
jgi:RNA polymerase sigma-70 factor (ECF subfamily)